MSANLEIPTTLNEQQLLMLRLLKKPLPDEDFQQIRRLAVKLLSHQMDAMIDEWESENNITPKYYDELAKSHFRSK